jgi:plasmid maintenance system antidote protein VapI
VIFPDHPLRGKKMPKAKKKRSQREPISKALRQTIRERDLTAYSAAKRAGVSADAVQRFMNAKRGLTLATVDKLADALELTLCRNGAPEDRVT